MEVYQFMAFLLRNDEAGCYRMIFITCRNNVVYWWLEVQVLWTFRKDVWVLDILFFTLDSRLLFVMGTQDQVTKDCWQGKGKNKK